MGFTNATYDIDGTVKCLLRVSDEYMGVVGDGGTATHEFHIEARPNAREFGIHPRSLTLTREVGTAPDTFTKSITVPIATQADFDAQTIGSTETIDGNTWTVSGKNPQVYV